MRKRLRHTLKRITHRVKGLFKKEILTDRDVLLVSYPRSGNTWVRFLLANLLSPEGVEIDFHNLHLYVPELDRNEDIIESLVPPRVVKSHALFKKGAPKVIYLVRDGRDVYASYYYYRLKQLEEGTSFGDFLRREDHYPSRWKEHLESWLDAGLSDQDLLVVRYEDLLDDPQGSVKQMVDFIGLNASDQAIAQAIENSRFDRMRKIDQTKGRKYNLTGTKEFVRKGKAGSWEEEFSQDDVRFFKDTEGDLLIRLGYEQDSNW